MDETRRITDSRRHKGDCFGFVDGSQGDGEVEVLLGVESLRYRLAPEGNRRISILLDVVFRKKGQGDGYLSVIHPQRVTMEAVPDVFANSDSGARHSTLLEGVYGPKTVCYHNKGGRRTLEIRCTHFTEQVQAECPILEIACQPPATVFRLRADGDPDSKSDFTVGQLGPFAEEGVYTARIAVRIDGDAVADFEVVRNLFRVEGPGRVLGDLSAQMESMPQTPSDSLALQAFRKDVEATRRWRNPSRYDVLLLNGRDQLPHFTRLTRDIGRVETGDVHEHVLLFSSSDPRQEFIVELDFDPAVVAEAHRSL